MSSSIVVGLDVGNTTTEAVVAQRRGAQLEPLAWRRRPTAGAKGALASLTAAAALVRDLERELEVASTLVGVARLAPVHLATTRWPARPPDEGAPVRIVAIGTAGTRRGAGLVTGAHRRLTGLAGAPTREDVIVSVSADLDFAEAAARIRAARDRGWRVLGVLVARDEAVLIANRLDFDCPVVDEVDIDDLDDGGTVALEVAAENGVLRALTDPLELARLLGLPADQAASLTRVCRSLAASSVALVALGARTGVGASLDDDSWVEVADAAGERRLLLSLGPAALAGLIRPEGVRRAHAPAGSELAAAFASCPGGVRDLFAVDIDRAAHVPAALLAAASAAGAVDELAGMLDRQVLLLGAEASASRAGALSSPGVPPDALVCDIGGGTIDLARDGRLVTVAGAGALVTAGVAAALGIPFALAEEVKRYACMRVETPHRAVLEDGRRVFLDAPADGPLVGRLCVRTTSGRMVPFADDGSPGEWRDRRRRIKRDVIAGSLSRALGALTEGGPATLLLAGGGAMDDELVAVAGECLHGATVGRANMAGRLGPRYAVAWGLALLAEAER